MGLAVFPLSGSLVRRFQPLVFICWFPMDAFWYFECQLKSFIHSMIQFDLKASLNTEKVQRWYVTLAWRFELQADISHSFPDAHCFLIMFSYYEYVFPFVSFFSCFTPLKHYRLRLVLRHKLVSSYAYVKPILHHPKSHMCLHCLSTDVNMCFVSVLPVFLSPSPWVCFTLSLYKGPIGVGGNYSWH